MPKKPGLANPKTGEQLKAEHAKFIEKVITYLQKDSGLSIFDAQIATQTAELASRSPAGMVKVLEAALFIATLYRQECKGDSDSFFSTDMAVLGMKLTEALNKMQIGSIQFEEV